MSIVLNSIELQYITRCIKSLVYETTLMISHVNQNEPKVPDDCPLQASVRKDEDDRHADMLETMIGQFKEKDIDKEKYYVVLNRLSSQESGQLEQERAGYLYMLVRRSDSVPCMTYYARDKENVLYNFDHDWLKWTEETGNWFIYDRVNKCLNGKIIGDTVDDE